MTTPGDEHAEVRERPEVTPSLTDVRHATDRYKRGAWTAKQMDAVIDAHIKASIDAALAEQRERWPNALESLSTGMACDVDRSIVRVAADLSRNLPAADIAREVGKP